MFSFSWMLCSTMTSWRRRHCLPYSSAMPRTKRWICLGGRCPVSWTRPLRGNSLKISGIKKYIYTLSVSNLNYSSVYVIVELKDIGHKVPSYEGDVRQNFWPFDAIIYRWRRLARVFADQGLNQTFAVESKYCDLALVQICNAMIL